MSQINVSPALTASAYSKLSQEMITELMQRCAEWESSAKAAASHIDELENVNAALLQVNPEIVKAISEELETSEATIMKYIKPYFDALVS